VLNPSIWVAPSAAAWEVVSAWISLVVRPAIWVDVRALMARVEKAAKSAVSIAANCVVDRAAA
jgi:hypothetical protein